MRTTLEIPDVLLTEAQKFVGANTKTQTIILALHEMVQKRKSRQLMELRGSMKGTYDYKALRKKR